jgi:hypothetical protein
MQRCVMGSLADQPLQDIWQSAEYVRLPLGSAHHSVPLKILQLFRSPGLAFGFIKTVKTEALVDKWPACDLQLALHCSSPTKGVFVYFNVLLTQHCDRRLYFPPVVHAFLFLSCLLNPAT